MMVENKAPQICKVRKVRMQINHNLVQKAVIKRHSTGCPTDNFGKNMYRLTTTFYGHHIKGKQDPSTCVLSSHTAELQINKDQARERERERER